MLFIEGRNNINKINKIKVIITVFIPVFVSWASTAPHALETQAQTGLKLQESLYAKICEHYKAQLSSLHKSIEKQPQSYKNNCQQIAHLSSPKLAAEKWGTLFTSISKIAGTAVNKKRMTEFIANAQQCAQLVWEKEKINYKQFRQLILKQKWASLWPHSPALKKYFVANYFEHCPTILKPDRMRCTSCQVEIYDLREADIAGYFHGPNCQHTLRVVGLQNRDILLDPTVSFDQLIPHGIEHQLLALPVTLTQLLRSYFPAATAQLIQSYDDKFEALTLWRQLNQARYELARHYLPAAKYCCNRPTGQKLQPNNGAPKQIIKLLQKGSQLYTQLSSAMLTKFKPQDARPHFDQNNPLCVITRTQPVVAAYIQNIILDYAQQPLVIPRALPYQLNNIYTAMHAVLIEHQHYNNFVSNFLTKSIELATDFSTKEKLRYEAAVKKIKLGIKWPHSEELKARFKQAGFTYSPTVHKNDLMKCAHCGVKIYHVSESDCPEYYHHLDCQYTLCTGYYAADITADHRVTLQQIMRYAMINNLWPQGKNYVRAVQTELLRYCTADDTDRIGSYLGEIDPIRLWSNLLCAVGQLNLGWKQLAQQN